MKINKNLMLAGIGLVLIVLIAGLALGPRILRKVKRTFLSSNPAPTATSQVENASTSAETVSGNITLAISAPSDGSTVDTPDITISGKTTPNAEVSVNDQDTKADSNGDFSVKLTLDEGDNPVTVTASDEQGNYIEKDITVNFLSPAN